MRDWGALTMIFFLMFLGGVLVGWAICMDNPPPSHQPPAFPVGTRVTHKQTGHSGIVCGGGAFRGMTTVSWDQTGRTQDVSPVVLEEVIEPECETP